MKYEDVYKDHSYLWSIGEAYDMTGGYVDQGDLDRLLKNPTKRTAKYCLIRQMEYWFEVGPDINGGEICSVDIHTLEGEYPDIRAIAERYDISY